MAAKIPSKVVWLAFGLVKKPGRNDGELKLNSRFSPENLGAFQGGVPDGLDNLIFVWVKFPPLWHPACLRIDIEHRIIVIYNADVPLGAFVKSNGKC